MSKLVVISLFGVFLLLNPSTSLAAFNLPWSTTYNCNEWKTSDGQNPNCDSMWEGGGWTCDNGDGTYKEEQITAAANYSGDGGGKGQRHWLGDGVNNTSGGMSASFLSSQTEIWVRWYMRYEQGFEWNPYLMNQKILYFDPVSFPRLIVEYYGQDKVQIYSYASSQGYPSAEGNGWNTMMANGGTDARGNKTSDGQWHLWEFHVKIDTNGTDGILELWIDNNKVINVTNANLAAAPLTTLLIGSNGFTPGNGRCMYVDYDDISISNTGPIGGDTPPPSGGNPPSNNSDSTSGGSGCGFVKDNNKKGQGAKGEGLSLILLFLLLIFILLSKTRYRRLLMRKSSIFFLAGVLLFLNANISLAAVNLPWSTTYNCADWTQSNGNVSCDGLTDWGGWTCDNGDGTVEEEQITSAANYTGTGSGGGKGQRHWKGDGTNNVSGGLRIAFNSPQSELWVRFYMRYEQGFEWSPLNNDKVLYIDVGTSYYVVFGHFWSDETGFVVNGNPYYSGTGNGWNTIMTNGPDDARGNKKSDGQWYLYEIHIKMDTNGSNGIGEIWIDGVRRMSRSDIDFGSQTGKAGWSHILIGSNNRYPLVSRCMFIDFDDISISGVAAASTARNNSSSGSSDSSSSGSGCGFVKDNGKGPKAKGEGLAFTMMLIIALAGTTLLKKWFGYQKGK